MGDMQWRITLYDGPLQRLKNLYYAKSLVLFGHAVWKITSCFQKFDLKIGENSANKLTTNSVSQMITGHVMTRLLASFCEYEDWKHTFSVSLELAASGKEF